MYTHVNNQTKSFTRAKTDTKNDRKSEETISGVGYVARSAFRILIGRSGGGSRRKVVLEAAPALRKRTLKGARTQLPPRLREPRHRAAAPRGAAARAASARGAGG